MADKEEGEETTARGNDWEVVSLTASAYAAAPGPEQVELKGNDNGNTVEADEAETSRAMFMSRHFVFPPSQHENLPLEAENIEIQNVQGAEDIIPEQGADEGDRSDTKDEENWSIKGLSLPEEFPGSQFYDEKVNRLSIHETQLVEDATLQGLNVTEIEQSMYSDPKFSSFHSETTMDGSSTYENTGIPGQTESTEVVLDSDLSKSPETAEEDNEKSGLPCEAWWKRGAASIYAQAKEANAFWSVFIAAAVMGLVILGQQWQQERWQVLQLKWQFSLNDERMGRMLGPVTRLKDAIVGGSRKGIRGGSSTEH